MSPVEKLLDEAHKISGLGGFQHVVALVQRRTNRRTLEWVAKCYRAAADLVEEAANHLPNN